MAWRVEQLSDRILRMLRPEERKLLGRAGMTAEEAMQRATIKNERDLQRLIENLLRLKGITAIRSRMDRKTSNNIGTPDFIFAIRAIAWDGGDQRTWQTRPVAWEVKLPGKELEPKQESMRKAMTTAPNAWIHQTITSVDDALTALRNFGIK